MQKFLCWDKTCKN